MSRNYVALTWLLTEDISRKNSFSRIGQAGFLVRVITQKETRSLLDRMVAVLLYRTFSARIGYKGCGLFCVSILYSVE
jgi:hypothetical protein